MAKNANSAAQDHAVSDLHNRLEWLDEERRKLTRKLAEMEQRVEIQERELTTREQRIQTLERQLASFNSQLTRLPQIDAQLAQFKDDIVKMIEQYDQRRLQSEAELDRLRRVEHEGTARELASLRKEITKIPRIQSEVEQRKSEEARLGKLIAAQKNQLSEMRHKLENWDNAHAFLEEKEKQNSRNIAELQASLVEINKRAEHVQTRFDALGGSIPRVESKIQAVIDEQVGIVASTRNWKEQIQIGEYERNQKLENWRRLIEDQTDAIEQFKKEWVAYSDQYKEAKMAVQTISQWQEQIEKQQREAAELLRVESHRMQSRWDDFQLESEKAWRNLEVDIEQRWANANRHEREIQEKIQALHEILEKLEQEKDMLWRIQSAQSDAMKQFPRIWLEEVEKAINQNPHRRRQPALVPVREE